MTLTIARTPPALLLVFMLLACSAPAWSSGEAHHKPHPGPVVSTAARVDLYALRVRRSTINYLRLRLLELHEEGLDRARAAIERRLSIDELLKQPAPPERTDAVRGRPPQPQRMP